MSYPQFNLTTLQLPAPASNMTKAEYKAAYGIDLDEVNIKAFKLVLLGNEKYTIDQIKEVEDGIEIYFNGHILSITDIVQTSDKVYDVANSKPIYCHPITVSFENAELSFYIACLIFNQKEDAYTWDTLKSYLNSFSGTLAATGSAYDKTNSKYMAITLIRNNNENIYLYGIESDGNKITSGKYKIDNLTITEFSDAVNKIN